MLITIQLGVQWGQPTTIRTLAHSRYAEFNPDDIFDALQRIGGHYPEADHEQCDLDRIAAKYEHPWSLTLTYARKAMARAGAPSMSVGDIITVETAADENHQRTPVVEYVCKPMGWETRAPAPVV